MRCISSSWTISISASRRSTVGISMSAGIALGALNWPIPNEYVRPTSMRAMRLAWFCWGAIC
jgi:hypothetical protein